MEEEIGDDISVDDDKNTDISDRDWIGHDDVQRSAKVCVRGCEKFVPALAYLFCLALPGSCLARFAYFFADLCSYSKE